MHPHDYQENRWSGQVDQVGLVAWVVPMERSEDHLVEQGVRSGSEEGAQIDNMYVGCMHSYEGLILGEAVQR